VKFSLTKNSEIVYTLKAPTKASAHEWVDKLRERFDFYRDVPEVVDPITSYVVGNDDNNDAQEDPQIWAAHVHQSVRTESLNAVEGMPNGTETESNTAEVRDEVTDTSSIAEVKPEAESEPEAFLTLSKLHQRLEEVPASKTQFEISSGEIVENLRDQLNDCATKLEFTTTQLQSLQSTREEEGRQQQARVKAQLEQVAQLEDMLEKREQQLAASLAAAEDAQSQLRVVLDSTAAAAARQKGEADAVASAMAREIDGSTEGRVAGE
jgi:DNA repair exonuclease SbcCD ATPase subunit